CAVPFFAEAVDHHFTEPRDAAQLAGCDSGHFLCGGRGFDKSHGIFYLLEDAYEAALCRIFVAIDLEFGEDIVAFYVQDTEIPLSADGPDLGDLIRAFDC